MRSKKVITLESGHTVNHATQKRHRTIGRVCRLGPEHVDLLVPTYRQVYGEVMEWDEYKRCEAEGCQNGLFSISEYLQRYQDRRQKGENPNHCDCGALLVDRWDSDTVSAHIHDEVISHPQGLGVVQFQLLVNEDKERELGTAAAIIGCALVGFAWGYGTDARQLEKEKSIPGLAEAVNQNFGGYEVFYQSEWGVVSLCRGTGVGTNLFFCRMQAAINAGHRVGIFRTNPNARSNSAERRWGYREVLRYSEPTVKGGISLVLGGELKKVQQTFEELHAQELSSFAHISPGLNL